MKLSWTALNDIMPILYRFTTENGVKHKKTTTLFMITVLATAFRVCCALRSSTLVFSSLDGEVFLLSLQMMRMYMVMLMMRAMINWEKSVRDRISWHNTHEDLHHGIILMTAVEFVRHMLLGLNDIANAAKTIAIIQTTAIIRRVRFFVFTSRCQKVWRMARYRSTLTRVIVHREA